MLKKCILLISMTVALTSQAQAQTEPSPAVRLSCLGLREDAGQLYGVSFEYQIDTHKAELMINGASFIPRKPFQVDIFSEDEIKLKLTGHNFLSLDLLKTGTVQQPDYESTVYRGNLNVQINSEVFRSDFNGDYPVKCENYLYLQ